MNLKLLRERGDVKKNGINISEQKKTAQSTRLRDSHWKQCQMYGM